MAVQDGQVLHRVPLGDGGQTLQAPLQTAEDAVDHPRRPGVLAVGPGQLYGPVDRCAVGDPVQKEHLVGPQAQGLDHPPLHPLEGDIGEMGQVEVQEHLVLQNTGAQLGGQRRVPAVQSGRRYLLF